MTRSSTISLEFAAITDIGCSRSNNEDSYGYDSEKQIWAVCDGMGGRAAGEVASSLAVRTLIESYGSSEAWTENGEPVPPANRLLQAIWETNLAVREAASKNPELHSMGTTLVCVCFDGNDTIIANVGDSRAYLVREGRCQQITQDHSLLAEALSTGEISAESAAASNLQSVITRAIGVEDAIEPDLFASQLQPDDILLLASDGLTRYAEQKEILAAIQHSPDLAGACQSLIDFAKSRGGVDNITCILVRVIKSKEEVQPLREDERNEPPTPPEETDAFSAAI